MKGAKGKKRTSKIPDGKKSRLESDLAILASEIMKPSERYSCCKKRVGEPHADDCPMFPKQNYKPPFVPTGEKNGKTVGRRYYAYEFTPAVGITDPHLQSVAQALKGQHRNIGDFWLTAGLKTIGIRDIKMASLVWEDPNTTLSFKVNKVGVGMTILGNLEPTESYVEWKHEDGHIVHNEVEVRIREVHPEFVTHPPLQNGGTEVLPRKERPAPHANGSVQGAGKREKIFGHHITAVLRWMGRDAWTFDQARLVMKKLGVTIADPTIHAQLHAGRNNQRGDPADLTESQADQLYQHLEGDQCPTSDKKSVSGKTKSRTVPTAKKKRKKSAK